MQTEMSKKEVTAGKCSIVFIREAASGAGWLSAAAFFLLALEKTG
jgi:hypothetical protein